VSLFFRVVSAINFLISSRIIAILHNLWEVYSLSVLEAIMSVTRSDITSYFSSLSVYYGDKYVAPDMSDFRSTSNDYGSAACSICRQDSAIEESTDASSSFSSAPTMEGSPEAWVIPMTPKMPFLMEGFGDSEGGGKKTVQWSTYMEELDSTNFASFELMPTENGLVGKENTCASPVRNLVLDRTESNYVVPAVLSHFSSNGEKDDGEPWDGDAFLYAVIILGTYSTAM